VIAKAEGHIGIFGVEFTNAEISVKAASFTPKRSSRKRKAPTMF
tara:strand:- start:5044 stop:5175 length:132 start_codon:yes stop_codon:yes gene_type:complete